MKNNLERNLKSDKFKPSPSLWRATQCNPTTSPREGEGSGLHRPWCHKILGTRPRMTGAGDAGFVLSLNLVAA